MSNHILHKDRTLPLASVGFEIDPNVGECEDIADGRPYHALSIWADPADDQFPRIQMTGVDLYLDNIPDALDGLRLRIDTESGDFVDAPDAWIRPGSLVGAAEVIFEPASREESGDWDPSARKNLAGPLELDIDKHGDEYRIRIAVGIEGEYSPADGRATFFADFTAPLEIVSYDR